MANFCGMCGAKLDVATGLCPNCNKEQIATMTIPVTPAPQTQVLADNQAENSTPVTEENDMQNTTPLEEELTTATEEVNAEAAEAVQEMPPYIPEQAAEQNAVAPENTLAGKKRKQGPKFVAVLLSILLFFFASGAFGVFFVRNTLSGNTFENIIDATEEEWSKRFSDTDFTDSMLDDYGIRIDEDNIVEFLEESTVKEFISNKVSDFFDAVFDGENELVFTSDEIKELLEDNEDAIEEVFDKRFTEEELEDISKRVVGDSHEYVIKIDEFVPELEEYDELLDIFTTVFSYTTMVILLALSAAMIFLLVLNSPTRAACGIGVNLILIGGFYLIIAVTVLLVENMELINIADDSGMAKIMTVVYAAIKSVLPLAITMFVIGVALLIIRKVILSKQAKKEMMNSYN